MNTNQKKTFIVTAKHTPDECLQNMEEIKNSKTELLSKTYFHCNFGEHATTTVLQANDEKEVRNQLPKFIANKATIRASEQLTPKQVEEMHRQGAHA